MATNYRQLSLADLFKNCQDMFFSDTPTFFSLLEKNIDLNDFIPPEFCAAFYKRLGRNRDYPLQGFLPALILQKIFSIPSDSVLILFLTLCCELRSFCGFKKVPDAPLFIRFKQDLFLLYYEKDIVYYRIF